MDENNQMPICIGHHYKPKLFDFFIMVEEAVQPCNPSQFQLEQLWIAFATIFKNSFCDTCQARSILDIDDDPVGDSVSDGQREVTNCFHLNVDELKNQVLGGVLDELYNQVLGGDADGNNNGDQDNDNHDGNQDDDNLDGSKDDDKIDGREKVDKDQDTVKIRKPLRF